MKTITLMFALALSTLVLSAPAHAARGIVVSKPSGSGAREGRTVSLASGTYCYTLFERRSESPKLPSTFYLEISEAEGGVCLDDIKGRSIPENDISMGLVATLPVTDAGATGIKSVNQVKSLTTMELIANAAAQGPAGPAAMKNGTVKFFNETKRVFVHTTGLADKNGELFLVLPEELQGLVDELSKSGGKVIIILRELREGKKGLNAVNVKLA